MADNRKGWYQRTFGGAPEETGGTTQLLIIGLLLVLIVSLTLKSCFAAQREPDSVPNADKPPTQVQAEMETGNTLDAAAESALDAAANAVDAAAVHAGAAPEGVATFPPPSSSLEQLSHGVYVDQCVEAMERGHDPAVMSLQPSERRAMCEILSETDRRSIGKM